MENGDPRRMNFRYSEIQQQLSGLLPDITFSSDEDEVEDEDKDTNDTEKSSKKTDQILQPFLRENAESIRNLAFEIEESGNYDFNEDMDLDILDSQYLREDSRFLEILPIQNNNNTFNDLHKDIDISGAMSLSNQQSIQSSSVNRTNEGENEKSLFFGLVDPGDEENARIKYLPPSDLTLQFGVRGDINLDEYFSDYPETSNSRPSAHSLEIDLDESTENAEDGGLLNALSKLAETYSLPNNASTKSGVSKQNGTYTRFIPAKCHSNVSTTSGSQTKKTPQPDIEDSTYVDMKIPETVHLDLRQNGSSTTSSVKCNTENVPRPAPVVITPSSVQEKLLSVSTNMRDDIPPHMRERMKQGSWLENFRRQKQLAEMKKLNAPQKEEHIGSEGRQHCGRYPNGGVDMATVTSQGGSVVNRASLNNTIETDEQEIETIDLQQNSNNVRNGIAERETISDQVSMKIQKIKERENVLSCRRLMMKELCDRKPRGMNDTTPILFHEEASFERPFSSLPLNQSCCSETRSYSLVITLRSSYDILTTTKHSNCPAKSLDTDLDKNYSYIALLTWLCSLLKDDKKPFRVLGLIQSAWSGGQMFLNIRVSRDESGPETLKQFLQNHTLREVCSQSDFLEDTDDRRCSAEQISDASLASFIEIDDKHRYFDWSKSELSNFYWSKIVTEDRCQNWLIDDQFDIENASVTITSRSILPGGSQINYLFWLLKRCQLEGLDLAGFRLLHGNPIASSIGLGMVFRGHGAVNSIRHICGPGANSVFHNVTAGWSCSRFTQTVDQELAKYFGPRLNNYSNIESFFPSANPSPLVYVQPSDLLMLVSPICPDIGWILHVTAQRGLPLIGCMRIALSQSTAEEIGMNHSQIEVFSKSGVCHLLLFRYENILNHASKIVKECHDYLLETSTGVNLPHPCYLYYAMPFASKLLETLDATKMHQLPAVHELTSTVIPDPINEDCECYSFVLIISETNQQVLSEVLDQCSKHDLLAIKCLPQLSTEHLNLLEKEFQLVMSPQMRESHRLVSSQLVYRGLYLHQTLRNIQNCLKEAKNVIFAYTVDHWHTYRLITSFFSLDELKSEPRRRQAKNFYPVESSEFFDVPHLMNEMSSCQTQICAAFSVSIDNKPDILHFLITLWTILDSEDFRMEYFFLKSAHQMDIVVKRPNAVFRLLGLAEKTAQIHFIHLPSCLEESEQFANGVMAEINEPNIQRLKLNLSPDKPAYDEINLILIRKPVLMDKSNSYSKVIQILSFLHRKGYKMLGVRQFNISNQIIQELKRFKLINYNQKNVSEEDRYLALLFSGRLAAMTTRDLMRNDTELSNLIRNHGAHIFLTESSDETMGCANLLFDCIVVNPVVQFQ